MQMRIICICISDMYNGHQLNFEPIKFRHFWSKPMKLRTIAHSTLFTAMSVALAQPALAVTDEELKALQDQLNMLAEQVEENSSKSGSDTTADRMHPSRNVGTE